MTFVGSLNLTKEILRLTTCAVISFDQEVKAFVILKPIHVSDLFVGPPYLFEKAIACSSSLVYESFIYAM